MTDPIYPTVRGWQCPVCQSVWAPFVSRCEECAKNPWVAPTDVGIECNHEWLDRGIYKRVRQCCGKCGAVRAKEATTGADINAGCAHQWAYHVPPQTSAGTVIDWRRCVKCGLWEQLPNATP